MVEQLTCNEQVAGSNPAWGSKVGYSGGVQKPRGQLNVETYRIKL